MASELELPRLSAAELKSITSFQAAMDLALQRGEVISSEEAGDGFSVIKEDGKVNLVGITFVILDYRVGHDDVSDRDYCVLRLVTAMDQKLIMTDGSTGVFAQLKLLFSDRSFAPVVVPGGLVKSDYIYTDENTGKQDRATTYYLNTTAA